MKKPKRINPDALEPEQLAAFELEQAAHVRALTTLFLQGVGRREIEITYGNEWFAKYTAKVKKHTIDISKYRASVYGELGL